MNDGSQFQTYQNVLSLNIFYSYGCGTSISRKLCTGERIGNLLWKSMCILTNQQNMEGNDTPAASELSIFVNTWQKWNLKMFCDSCKALPLCNNVEGTCFFKWVSFSFYGKEYHPNIKSSLYSVRIAFML